MVINRSIRALVVPLVASLLSLSLSGCMTGAFVWMKKPEAQGGDQVKVPVEKEKPPVKDLQAEKAVAAEKKADPALEKPPPRQSPPQNPEGTVPVPLPLPASVRPQAVEPQPPPAGPVRRLAATRPPDFSYRDAIIIEDTAWSGEVLIEGGVTIAPQTTLTVKNGTVIRFRGGAGAAVPPVLAVQGRIVVNGSTDRQVVFTSQFEEVAAGDWQGIVLLASGKKNLFEHCRVEGAETGLDAAFSNVTLKNASFAKCRVGARLQECLTVMNGGGSAGCGIGLLLYDSEADIRAAAFSGNRQGIFAARSSLSLAGATLAGNEQQALAADSCRLSIMGSSFSANGTGISLAGCEGAVSTNRITKNAVYGMVLAQSRVRVNGNEIEQNGKVGLRVEDGKGIAWGNALGGNGSYDLYNGGSEEFRAIGNWWGGDAAAVAGRIYDRRQDGGRGRVLYLPLLPARPAPALP
jgi:Periplasmic copper-binding protein (NosD)